MVIPAHPKCQISLPTSMAALFGNPGPSGIGVVIAGSTNGTIRIAKWIGHQDNNVAEYVALLEALQCALGLKAKTLHVFSDSEVVVKQMIGEYSCRSPRLYSLNWTCRKLARWLDFSISHIRGKTTQRPIVWPVRRHAREEWSSSALAGELKFNLAHNCVFYRLEPCKS